MPGECERSCEIVTPPIERDHEARLEALLAPARGLGFTIPKEAAVHVHFDGARLRDARAFRNLVRLVETWAPAMKRVGQTNRWCRRLGGWPEALHDVVEGDELVALPWQDAQRRLQDTGLTKYCDVNLENIVHDVPDKPTIEARIFPGLDSTAKVLECAALFEAVLWLAVDTHEITRAAPSTDVPGVLRAIRRSA